MSERGSFCTEYIYCEKCFEAASKVLLGNDKYLCSEKIHSWAPGEKHLPIIAGKVGGLYMGQELVDFEFEYIPQIKATICHPMRIAVLAEDSEKIFELQPMGGEK